MGRCPKPPPGCARHPKRVGMAIYHCQAKTVSRSSGRSAVAAMAYRAGDRLTDERTGQMHDYSRRHGVLESGIVAPEDAPAWAQDREALWNAAEAAEKRKDAKTAREYEIALPHELTDEQRSDAVREFCTWYSERHGVAADYAIHAPHAHGDQRNYHAHILTTTRRLEAEGFGAKTRELDSFQTSGPLLEEVREQWEGIANRALERAGQEARIDRRSLEAQGIDREPTVHLGPAASAMLRRGESSELAERNQAAAARNAEREGLQAQYGAVSAEIIDQAAERARREQEAKWREQADRIWAQQEAERKAREAQRQEAARTAQSELKEPQRPEVIRAAAPPQAPQPAQQPEAVRVPPPPEPAKPFEAASAVEPPRSPEAQKQPEAARAAEPPRQAEPAQTSPPSDAGKFWQTVRNAAMPADPNKPLSRDAGEIRLAYDLSTSGPGFIAGLKERGYGLAQVSAEDARQSLKEFEAAKAAPGTKYSPPLREGELVAVNKWGDVYTLTPRTLGDERAEIDKYLATIDRAGLPDVARAKAGQTAERPQARAEREQGGHPLSKAAGEIRLAYSLSRSGPDFIAGLKARGFVLAQASAQEARDSSARGTATYAEKGQKKSEAALRDGELVAVDKWGEVHRITVPILGEVRPEVDRYFSAIKRGRLPSITQAKAGQQKQRDRVGATGHATASAVSENSGILGRTFTGRAGIPTKTAADILDGLGKLFTAPAENAAKAIEGQDASTTPLPRETPFREHAAPPVGIAARETPEELVRRLEEEKRIKRREALARQYAQSVVRERESERDLDDEGGRTR